MNVALALFAELEGEWPSGVYPTLDDYSAAFKALREQSASTTGDVTSAAVGTTATVLISGTTGRPIFAAAEPSATFNITKLRRTPHRGHLTGRARLEYAQRTPGKVSAWYLDVYDAEFDTIIRLPNGERVVVLNKDVQFCTEHLGAVVEI